MDGPRKARLIWNAVEDVSEEHMVNRGPGDICNIVGVSLEKRAVGRTTSFGNPHLRLGTRPLAPPGAQSPRDLSS